MYAVVVTITLKEDTEERFMPLVLANAAASLEKEEGCRQFDVARDPARPGEVFLYELYVDRAAFDAHLASSHFMQFDGQSAAFIAAKTMQTYSEVVQ